MLVGEHSGVISAICTSDRSYAEREHWLRQVIIAHTQNERWSPVPPVGSAARGGVKLERLDTPEGGRTGMRTVTVTGYRALLTEPTTSTIGATEQVTNWQFGWACVKATNCMSVGFRGGCQTTGSTDNWDPWKPTATWPAIVFLTTSYKPIFARNWSRLVSRIGLLRSRWPKRPGSMVMGGGVMCCIIVLASKRRKRKRTWGASPHTMSLKLRHYRFGKAFEKMCPSFWHGGEGCAVAVSVRALEGRFVGPKYAAGQSSVISEHYKS